MAKKEQDAPAAYVLTVKCTFRHAGVKFQPGTTYTVKPHIYEAIKDKVAQVVAK